MTRGGASLKLHKKEKCDIGDDFHQSYHKVHRSDNIRPKSQSFTHLLKQGPRLAD